MRAAACGAPALISGAAFAQCPPAWDARYTSPPGPVGNIDVVREHDDGSGPAIYVGGSFHCGPDFGAVGRFDGMRWVTVGPFQPNEPNECAALLTFDEDGDGPLLPALIAGAAITPPGEPTMVGVLRWDGVSWTEMGDLNNGAQALHLFDEDGPGPMHPSLYAGGLFYNFPGGGIHNVVRWNGAQWEPSGTGLSLANTYVRDLATFDADGAGPLPARLIASVAVGSANASSGVLVLENGAWGPFGGAGAKVEGSVRAMAAFGDATGETLFIVGTNMSWPGAPEGPVMARWDGAQWAAITLSVGAHPSCFTALDTPEGKRLFVGGSREVSQNYYATAWRLEGSSWSVVGGTPPVTGGVHSLGRGRMGGREWIFAGGTGSLFGQQGIARGDGVGWVPIGNAFNAPVTVLASGTEPADSPPLIVAGSFLVGGNGPLPHIGALDADGWRSLGAGLPSATLVRTVTHAESGRLFAGGPFVQLATDGQPMRGVAEWTGSAWKALGAGLQGPAAAANAVLWRGDDPAGPSLYAGGTFTFAGGGPASRIARWDGAQWRTMGEGLNSTVHALTLWDTDGPGPEPKRLLAGGVFTASGASPLSRVAVWDGTQWTALGAGLPIDGVVYAFAPCDEAGAGSLSKRLFMGGTFTQIGPLEVRGVARLEADGTWSSPGGVGPIPVYAMVSHDPDGPGPLREALHVGGQFAQVGALSVSNLARWDGEEWAPVGEGTNGSVLALASHDVDGPGPVRRTLYVGGSFSIAGGVESQNFAALAPPTGCCPGDANGDNVVDFLDLNIVLSDFGQTGAPGSLQGDLDDDGDCDFIDLNIVLSAFGTAC